MLSLSHAGELVTVALLPASRYHVKLLYNNYANPGTGMQSYLKELTRTFEQQHSCVKQDMSHDLIAWISHAQGDTDNDTKHAT